MEAGLWWILSNLSDPSCQHDFLSQVYLTNYSSEEIDITHNESIHVCTIVGYGYTCFHIEQQMWELPIDEYCQICLSPLPNKTLCCKYNSQTILLRMLIMPTMNYMYNSYAWTYSFADYVAPELWWKLPNLSVPSSQHNFLLHTYLPKQLIAEVNITHNVSMWTKYMQGLIYFQIGPKIWELDIEEYR